MRKLLNGIVDFRKRLRPGYRETFARLALGQKPDALFIACSDSRVVPNLFASTDPGDLFVVRNVGNLIPACRPEGCSTSDESEMAAIEFALLKLSVSDIVVCGHSECGAMEAMIAGREGVEAPHLRKWLRHAELSLERLRELPQELPRQIPQDYPALDASLTPQNRLSQLNAVTQLQNLRSYSLIRERLGAGKLRLHAWWFDIGNAEVLAYDESSQRFRVIDERRAQRLLSQLSPAETEAERSAV